MNTRKWMSIKFVFIILSLLLGQLVSGAGMAEQVEAETLSYLPLVIRSSDMIDPAFGENGMVTTDFHPGIRDFGRALALQPDGKFVLAGGSDDAEYLLARYNPDGSLDATFDGDGWVETAHSPDWDMIHALVIQADGKIVAGGVSSHRFSLARYNPDGSLDATFDGDGLVATTIYGEFDEISDLALQQDGKIVALGPAQEPYYDSDEFALARYNTDGSLDTSFGGDGIVTSDFYDDYDVPSKVLVQPDGKIVAVGLTIIEGYQDILLARYNTDGSLDTGFGSAGQGWVTTDMYDTSIDTPTDMLIQPDGKLVVAGYTYPPGEDEFMLLRYNPDGSLDTGFDGDGKTAKHFTGYSNHAHAVALQENGKILVAGYADISSYPYFDSVFLLARYNSDGTLDTSFDDNGWLTTDFATSDDECYAMVIQPDGKIVLGGNNTNSFELVRYK